MIVLLRQYPLDCIHPSLFTAFFLYAYEFLVALQLILIMTKLSRQKQTDDNSVFVLSELNYSPWRYSHH